MLRLDQGCSSAPHVQNVAPPISVSTIPKTDLNEVDFALKKLTDAGISKTFLVPLTLQLKKNNSKDSLIEDQDKVVSMNVLGFLSKADFSLHFTPRAIKKCREYLHNHYKVFLTAEKNYKVPKESIVALLWVETKLGKYVGSDQLIHSYLSLLLADHPAVFAHTLREFQDKKVQALKERPTYTEASLESKIVDRSIKKAAWALDQLKTMDQLYKKGLPRLLKLQSSYAGAFGLPQFIPSTYLKYAVSSNGQTPNLFRHQDAILSVAHYLKESGWDESLPESRNKALFEYNRSKDYGDVILKIAEELSKKNVTFKK